MPLFSNFHGFRLSPAVPFFILTKSPPITDTDNKDIGLVSPEKHQGRSG
jgi:hypothetical protein